jgi:oligopeptide/dipeptide ABC transporter ATP-binding protein
MALLEVEDLHKDFPLRGGSPWSPRRGEIRAVDGVSFTIHEKGTFGLVGETGCGKTTTARLILRLEEPTSGRIAFRGVDLAALRGRALRRHRGNIQAVFQDPWSSLDPRMRARDIIAEPIVENDTVRKGELRERVADLLVAVGLKPADAQKFPHEFSGGQRQRIAIARAIALRPALIVLDEPVSSLDVSIRAQIMNLLRDLQEAFGMTYLLIAHDLATVRYLCRDVAVMYLGKIVERSTAKRVFARPLHPYTQGLLAAGAPVSPGADLGSSVLRGELPSPSRLPSGCRFRTRCPLAFERCAAESPDLREVEPGHFVACHLYGGPATPASPSVTAP